MINKPLKISLHYITNFKPKIDILRTNKFLFRRIAHHNEQILCRNLFLFFLFLKAVTQQKHTTINLFVKPKKNPHFTVLRAPYKYKLGRNQYGINRYYILVTFTINLNKTLNFYNPTHLIVFIKTCKKFYPWFETNICFQHKCVLFFYFTYKDWFSLMNYK